MTRALPLILLLALVGCPKADEKTAASKTSSGEESAPDPRDCVEEYLRAVLRDHDQDVAYSLLSAEDQKEKSKDEYLKENENPIRRAFAEIVFPHGFLGEVTIEPISEGKVKAVAEVTTVDVMKLLLSKEFRGRNLVKDETAQQAFLDELREKAEGLPRKITKRTLHLILEDGSWKVWLNLAGAGKANALRQEARELERKDPERAVAKLREALEAHPQSADATRTQLERVQRSAMRARAQRALKAGRWDEAIAEAKKAMAVAEKWNKRELEQLIEQAETRKANTVELGKTLRLGGVEVEAIGFGGLRPYIYKSSYSYRKPASLARGKRRCAVLALRIKNVSETMAIDLHASAKAVDEFGNAHEPYRHSSFGSGFQMLAGRSSKQKQITPGQAGVVFLYVEAPKIPKSKRLIWELRLYQDNTRRMGKCWVSAELPPSQAMRDGLRAALEQRAVTGRSLRPVGLLESIRDRVGTPLDFKSAAPAPASTPSSPRPAAAPGAKTIQMGQVLRVGGVEVCGLAFGALRPRIFKRSFGGKAEILLGKQRCAVLALSVKNVTDTMAIDLRCSPQEAVDEFGNKHAPYQLRSFSGSFQLLSGRPSDQKQLTPGQSGISLLYVEAPKIKKAKRLTFRVVVKTDNVNSYRHVSVECSLPPSDATRESLRTILAGRARSAGARFGLPTLAASIADPARTPLTFD